jgi:hypothetical protein
MVANVLISGIAVVAAPQLQGIPAGGWYFGDWLDAQAKLLGMMIATLLWYTPVGAWMMLASVLARRSPLLAAAVPLVVLAVSENIVLHSHYVWQFLGHRLRPEPDLWRALTLPELWLGLAAAAGMLYIVIRLRRYRDDT